MHSLRTVGRHQQFTRLTRRFLVRAVSYTSSFEPIWMKLSNGARNSTGLFGIANLHRPDDFLAAARASIQRCEDIVQQVVKETSPTVDTLRRLDLISDTICQVVDSAEACRNVHSDEDWREAANAVVYQLSEYIARLNVNRGLYDTLLRVMNSQAAAGFTEEQHRMCESLKEEFERDGMHLSGADRETAVELVGELNDACMQFVGNLHGEPSTFTVSPASFLRDLPQGYMTLVPKQRQPLTAEGPITLTCHPTMIHGILKHAKSPHVRKAAMQASLSQHAVNIPVLARLVAVRGTIAKRAGCSSYSAYILRHRMAGSPETVVGFLDGLATALKPIVDEELALLGQQKLKEEGNATIQPWDWQYYAAKLQSTEMRDLPLYFPLKGVLAGLQSVVKSVFGVDMSMLPVPSSEAWSASGTLLKCEFRDGATRLGVVYLDLLARPNKFQGAAHFVVRCGRAVHAFETTESTPDNDTVVYTRNGSAQLYQLPIVNLVMSFSSGERNPTIDSTLLSHGQVETLFHEFGHAMHSMLSRTEFQHLSGTRGTLDFMEFPSHFLECFAWDGRVLASFAKHAHTHHPIPQSYIHQLRLSNAQFAGINLQSQVVHAMFDQVLHGSTVPGLQLPINATPSQILEAVYAKYSSLPYVPDTHWECGFSHLASYGAGYYSYLFAQLYAAVVWDKFFAKDPWHGEGGVAIRTQVLEKGSSKDPAKILHDLLGYDARGIDASVLVRAKKSVD